MKRFSILMLLALLIVTGTNSCKKDNNQQNQGPVQGPGGATPPVPTDADGALYAIRIDGLSVLGTAMAWFESYVTTAHVTELTANTTLLSDSLSGFALPWYMNTFDTPDFDNTNVTWVNSGNSAQGIPAFTHIDATTWPALAPFTVPGYINLSNSLTITFTATTANDGGIATIAGSKGRKDKFFDKNATSVTFTSAELNAVAYTGGDLMGVMLMPIAISNKEYGGKKYYFVKQQQYPMETTTL